MKVSSAAQRNIGKMLASTAEKHFVGNALVSCHQRFRMNYGRLVSVTTGFASGLLGLKYRAGDRIAMFLQNDAENLIVQLACSTIGVSVVTGKDGASLKRLAAELNCKGVVTSARHSTEVTLDKESHPMIVTGRCSDMAVSHLPFNDLVKAPLVTLPSTSDLNIPLAFYGSSNPTTQANLIEAAQNVLKELRLGTDDKVCLAVPLNHAFGFGAGLFLHSCMHKAGHFNSGCAGALAALVTGAEIVLPASSPDAEATLQAVESEGCTIMLADSHSLRALAPLRLGNSSIPWWATASAGDRPRAGLVKVGSGEALGLGPQAEWCGVPLTSVGQPPSV